MTTGVLNPAQLLRLNESDPSKAFGGKKADGLNASASGSTLHAFSHIMAGIIQRVDASSETSDPAGNFCRTLTDSDHKADALAALLTDQCRFRGQSPAATVVTPETLNGVSRFLHQAGFDAAEIDDTMEALQSRAAETGLMFSDLVSAVENLPSADLSTRSREDDILLEISSLPFLESILSRLGLEQNQIQEVTSGAVEEGRGINLTVLTENLQPVKERFFWNEPPMAAQHLQSGSEGETGHLMQRIGMGSVDGREAKSLNTFITRLESIAGQSHPAGANGTALNEEVEHLLQTTISPAAEKKSQEMLNLFRASSDSRFSESRNWNNLFEKPLLSSHAAAFSSPDRSSMTSGHQQGDDLQIGIAGKNVSTTRPALTRQMEELQNLLMKEGAAGQNIDIDYSPDTLLHGKNGPNIETENILRHSVESAVSNVLTGEENFSGFEERSASGRKWFFADPSEIVPGGKPRGEINEETSSLASSFPNVLDAAEGKDAAGTKQVRTPQLQAESVTQQVEQKLRLSIPRGDRQLQLHLKPDHLGRLQLNINNTGDQVTVHIITEHESTRDMLLNHSGELKAALMEQGIRLDKVDVQSTFNFEHYTAHHQQQQSNAFGGRRRNGRSVHLSRQAEEGGPDVDDILSDRHQRETGGLNIVA